jgi:hypothetical protein
MSRVTPSVLNAPRRSIVRRALLLLLVALPAVTVLSRGVARAQSARVEGDATKGAAGDVAALHLEMTPLRAPVPGDSARAAAVAAELRSAILRYRDTTAAVADGFRMFAPQIRNQKVYHFTRGLNAVQEAFRFDPAKPTSLLYTKGPDGTLVLVGGMYTAPKRFGAEKLDERIPLSIARWHKHVNWCVPPRGLPTRQVLV